MKKVFSILAIAGLLFLGTSNAFAQEEGATVDSTNVAATEDVAKEEVVATPEVSTPEESTPKAEPTFHQILKQRFIEGGAEFMGIVLVALILGLAIAIERIIYLNMATTNTKKLVAKIDEALASGGVDAAKEICRDTKGPVASIFYQGLDRSSEGIDAAEKAVVGYGGVQMGLLEKNISWLSLFIALAPMLGFMGTVIGMIDAFDAIQVAGDINPAVVAGGIKVALLTTVFGLVVAIILQVFYNIIVAKVDSIVNKMEDASISLIDLLVKYKK
ncbi:flagellar motor protein MotA [Wenyingzhuangia fucanilytica]|uniref:Flagellar motor protein MotA n=1 Tax=Wenyingzhuangia fucanilytica TaxID=1790137 RepID=A0A1B1Y7Y7_9FLAO|nr:MotA/TolQ/ExbB proton channel family protein [Wenyingzhuangia fucanilytica]ANW96892.1 flagellar motor protein MotA [Wenyingzhuangia fucanilytica]